MTKTSYDYTYANPKGYAYVGQVVADTDISAYDYKQGQTYADSKGGTYTISAAPGRPTTAPSGAVYQTAYADATGVYDSYHYDPKDVTYYNIRSGYDHASGMYTPPGGTPVPAWSGIGLSNEASYVNTGSATAPNYQTYGSGAAVNHTASTPTVYDYQFAYPDGSYYLGKVVDDGTYGYSVGQTGTKGVGAYAIYAKETAPPAATVKAGYDYALLYHDVTTNTNYPPSDIVPGTPYSNQSTGYGGVGSLKDYVQKTGGYYQFGGNNSAEQSPTFPSLPPLT